MLVDNMSVCLSFERRRARSFKVFMLIRKVCGISLALNLKVSFRWIASEANCSDEPSRRFDPEYQRSFASSICDVPLPSGPFVTQAGKYFGLPLHHGPKAHARFDSPSPSQASVSRALVAQRTQQPQPAQTRVRTSSP